MFNNIAGIATAAITLNGTKLVGTQTVDRYDLVGKSATIPKLNSNFKDISLVTGNILTLGAGSALDANGYPTALDTANPFTKQ